MVALSCAENETGERSTFWRSTGAGVRRVERYTRYHEQTVDVTYDGGYVTPKQVDDGTYTDRTLPHQIEEAVIQSVATAYALRGTPRGVESESIGSLSVSFANSVGPTTTVGGRAVTQSFADLAQRHRDRSVL